MVSRGHMALLALAAVVAVLLVGASGAGAEFVPPAPDSFTPGTVDPLVLGQGATGTVSSNLHLAPAPGRADVLIAVDTTGSMQPAIDNAKADAQAMVSQIQSAIPDTEFAVADFRDYTAFGNDFPISGSEYAYYLRQGLTSDGSAIQTAFQNMTAAGGGDDPEAYNRVFYEAAAARFPWRDKAARFVIVLGDQVPHDTPQTNDATQFSACLNTGNLDAGPDNTPGTSDDIHTLTALDALKASKINLSFVTYNNDSATGENSACHTQLAEYTGGKDVIHDPATGAASLGTQVVSLIQAAAARVDALDFTVTQVDGPATVATPSSWFSFDPPTPAAIPSTPTDIPVTETITTPADAVPGVYHFKVQPVADTALRGDPQVVTVDVRAQAISTLTMTADQVARPPGIASVPFASIPASRIPAFAGNAASTPGGSIPGGSIPGGSIPGGSIPGGSITFGSLSFFGLPGGSIPGGSIPGGSIPGGSIPGGSIPGGSIGVQSTLSHVLLSQLPLSGTTWDHVLAGSGLAGRALNTISLYDVAQDTVAWAHLKALPLSQVSFVTSLWGGIPVAAWLLGNAPISALPAPDGYPTWPDALNASGGSGAGIGTPGSLRTTSSSSPSDVTVFGIAAAGQLGSTDIGSIPGGSIAQDSLPGGSIPGGSIPGGSIPGGSIPAREISLRAIVANSQLKSVAITDIRTPADIVDCARIDCTTPGAKTLGDAAALNPTAINASASFGMLMDELPPSNSARQMTLSELIMAFLPLSSYPWEQLSIQGLQDVAGTGQNVDYHVDFDLACSIASTFRVRTQLPSGEFPIPGTTTFSYGGGAPVAGSDPGVDRKSGLTWDVGDACGDGTVRGTRHVRLNFSAYERLILGKHTSAVSVTANGLTTTATDQAPVLVTQAGEPDNNTGPVIQKDTLYVGHVGYAGDVDTRQFTLTGLDPGTKVIASLKVPQGADFDIVLGKPEQAGVRSNPGGSIPGGSIPIEDPGQTTDNSQSPLPPDTLADVPQSAPGGSIPGGSIPGGSIPGGSIPGGSISANRGSASEAAQIVTNGETGNATITISGYNNSFSTQPYVLRIRVVPPPVLPPCPAVTGLNTATPGALPNLSAMTATQKASYKTLFLVDRQRLAGRFGPTATAALLDDMTSSLNQVATRAEVQGLVLPVDGSSSVRSAYDGWDAKPCSIPAVNNVVRSINDLTDTYKAQLPNVKYVVVLGTDQSIPSWRQLDRAQISPEVDMAGDLAFTTSDLTAGNALYAAAAQNYVLNDGAYGVRQKISWLGSDLPLPQDSVSRLVESPADISTQLAQYIRTGGILDPKSELTTGDDFFADSAKAAHDAVDTSFGISSTNSDSLLPVFNPATKKFEYSAANPAWSRADLNSHFFTKATAPDIGVLDAHYNPWLAQPASPSPPTALSDLASTADVLPASLNPATTPSSLASRLLFTIGCHAGLNIPDVYSVSSADAYKQKDWAQTYAQQGVATYIANNGYGYDDTEAIALSGRLMLLFAQTLNQGDFSIGEEWTKALDSYYRTAGDWDVLDEKVMVEATMYGPPWSHFAHPAAAPATTAPSVGADNTATISNGSNGKLNFTGSSAINSHTTSDGRTWWDIAGQTLNVEYRSIQPLYTQDVTVPGKRARDAWINALSVHDVGGDVNPVRAQPAIQSTTNEPANTYPNIYWPAIPVGVLHSPRGDTLNVVGGQFRPNPDSTTLGKERQIDSIGVQVSYASNGDNTRPLITQVGGTMTDSSHVTFFVRATDNSGSLSKVAVLYNDGSGPDFTYEPLQSAGGDLYTGTATVTSPPEIIAEAGDAGGWVGFSSNKALNYIAFADTSKPDISIAAPIDGGTFTTGQAVPADFACSDPGGVKSCAGTVPKGQTIDTSVGTHQFTVTAKDLSDNTVSQTVSYTVNYSFSGFLPPVNNPPVLNLANAGRTIPVKWSLTNSGGVMVGTIASVKSISSKAIRCPSATVDPVENTYNEPLAALKVTGGQFNYNWSTQKTWAGSCRRLYVLTADNLTHTADFQFN